MERDTRREGALHQTDRADRDPSTSEGFRVSHLPASAVASRDTKQLTTQQDPQHSNSWHTLGQTHSEGILRETGYAI